MEKITGKNNDLIKSVKKLLSSSKERRVNNSFVLEGARLVFDALNSLCRIKCFLVTESAYDKYREQCDEIINRAEKTYLISDEISVKLSETEKQTENILHLITYRIRVISVQFFALPRLLALTGLSSAAAVIFIIQRCSGLQWGQCSGLTQFDAVMRQRFWHHLRHRILRFMPHHQAALQSLLQMLIFPAAVFVLSATRLTEYPIGCQNWRMI